MGCIVSSSSQVSAQARDPMPASYHPREVRYLKDALNLSDLDMSSLFRDFRKMDLNKQHRITYLNYTTYLKIRPLPLLETIFHYFSYDLHSLVFPEFILLVIFFLSLDEIGLAQFLHLLLFDETFHSAYFNSRNLTCDSTEKKVQLLLGNTWGNMEKIKKIIHKMGGVDPQIAAIDNQRFVNFCLKNRSLLNLIVTHHLTLKRKISTPSNKNNWEERTPESGNIWNCRNGIGNYLMNDIKRLRTALHSIEDNPNQAPSEVVPVAIPLLQVESEM